MKSKIPKEPFDLKSLGSKIILLIVFLFIAASIKIIFFEENGSQMVFEYLEPKLDLIIGAVLGFLFGYRKGE